MHTRTHWEIKTEEELQKVTNFGMNVYICTVCICTVYVNRWVLYVYDQNQQNKLGSSLLFILYETTEEKKEVQNEIRP